MSYGGEELPVKLSPENRADLEHALGAFGQPVDAGAQDISDGGRDLKSIGMGLEDPAALLLFDGAGLFEGGYKLFEKEEGSFALFDEEFGKRLLDFGGAQDGGEHLSAVSPAHP